MSIYIKEKAIVFDFGDVVTMLVQWDIFLID